MILVVGSLNLDIVTRVARIPRAGETVLGLDKAEYFGGKGANEAVCIARLDGRVCFAGALGLDAEGDLIARNMQNERVDTKYISRKPGAQTGIAMVTVEVKDNGGGAGENTVIVVPGANFQMSVEDLPPDFSSFSIIACQNEIPLETTLEAFRRAKQAKKQTFWNPAPAPSPSNPLVGEILKLCDILCVNETEAMALSEQSNDTAAAVISERELDEAIHALAQRVPHVVATLGSKGCAWKQQHASSELERFPAAPCEKVVDTTGAGDCFCGSLLWGLSRGEDMRAAIQTANRIAALSVQKPGAQNSYPYAKDLVKL